MRPKLSDPNQEPWVWVVCFFIAIFLVALAVVPVFVAPRNEQPRPAIRKVRLQTPSGVKGVPARVWETRSGLVIEFVDPLSVESMK